MAHLAKGFVQTQGKLGTPVAVAARGGDPRPHVSVRINPPSLPPRTCVVDQLETDDRETPLTSSRAADGDEEPPSSATRAADDDDDDDDDTDPSSFASIPSTPELPLRALPVELSVAALNFFNQNLSGSVPAHAGIWADPGVPTVSRCAVPSASSTEVPACRPTSSSVVSWYRVAFCGGISVREGPDAAALCTGAILQCGEVFAVSERVPGTDRRLYLRLASGAGWVFDDSKLIPEDPSVVKLALRGSVPVQATDCGEQCCYFATNPVRLDEQLPHWDGRVWVFGDSLLFQEDPSAVLMQPPMAYSPFAPALGEHVVAPSAPHVGAASGIPGAPHGAPQAEAVYHNNALVRHIPMVLGPVFVAPPVHHHRHWARGCRGGAKRNKWRNLRRQAAASGPNTGRDASCQADKFTSELGTQVGNVPTAP